MKQAVLRFVSSALSAVLVSAVAAQSSARAQEPETTSLPPRGVQPSPRLPTPIAAPPAWTPAHEPQTERRWYGGATIIAAVPSAALVPLAGLGFAGLWFAGPINHWAHGHAGRGFAVLAMNVALSSVGFAIGGWVCGRTDCAEDDDIASEEDVPGHDPLGFFPAALLGGAIGMLGALILDVGLVSYEDVSVDTSSARARSARPRERASTRATWIPGASFGGDHASLTLSGTF